MNKNYGGYTQIKLNEEFDVSSIFTIHYFRYGKNFSVRTEKHDFWEMVYIDSGEASILSGEKKLKLKQGQAYFHKPNELHTIYTENEFANSAIITFCCESESMNCLSDRIFALNDFEKQLLSKIITEGKNTFKDKLNNIYLEKMTKRESAPFAGEQLIKNCIELLLISIIRNNIDTFTAPDKAFELNNFTNSTDIIAERILEVLHRNIYNNINLETIAKELAFSKTYVKYVFKKHTGTTIIQYYIKLKIDEAKKLLSQNEHTVTEIADMLGFNSIHYFSKQFKNQTDMSPTEYVKSIKADNIL